jgi:protein-disulfide isomerase
MKRFLSLVIIIGVLGCALLAAWYLQRSTAETPLASQPGVSLPNTPTRSITLGADPPHTLGTEDAPVMLEEFGDFECSSCAVLHPTLTMMKSEFGPRLVIVFRQFPISTHKHALAAAQAAEAAALQGKFWEMHNLLYENQKTWHEATEVQLLFEDYATQIGLSLDRFRRDSSSDIVAQRITLDRERGYSIGVNSTPTVFLNGREVPPESLGTDKLRELIKAQVPPANRD